MGSKIAFFISLRVFFLLFKTICRNEYDPIELISLEKFSFAFAVFACYLNVHRLNSHRKKYALLNKFKLLRGLLDLVSSVLTRWESSAV